MRIETYGAENIGMIELRHDGLKVAFAVEQEPSAPMATNELERRSRVSIHFRDLIEVDLLIKVLERYRNECQIYAGNIRRIDGGYSKNNRLLKMRD